MKRNQRKARAKAIRLNQKAARKALPPVGDDLPTQILPEAFVTEARHALFVHAEHGPDSERPLISDARAKQMLANAAESLSLAERILKGCLDAVPTQVLQEAAAEMKAQAEADPDEERPQPPPAIRMVITLVRQLTTVTRLLQQVLKLTHPHLFELRPASKAA
jgi:hypothetical protein